MKISTKATGAALALGLTFSQQAAQAQESNPLSFNLGESATLTFYGYIKATYINDRDFDLGDTTKGLKNIGLATGPAAGTFERLHLKESRIGFDLRASDVLIKLEGDFFGTKNDLGLRTRLAYVDWNGLRVGQDWTNFMSVENLGRTVDFQGPAGVPFARLPQIRYTFSPAEGWDISASIEEDVGNDSDQHYTVAARKGFDGGMVRASGLYRNTTLGGTPVKGWGVALAGHVKAWEGGKLSGMVTTGEGISDILSFGLSGNAVTVGGNEVGVTGISLGIHQQVGDKVLLTATTGYTDLATATGTDTKTLKTLHLAAFYNVARNTELGIEYYKGWRTQGNGTEFSADRFSLAAKWKF